MPKVYITYEEFLEAKARNREIMDMVDQKGLSTAQKACADIMRFFLTQENYQLTPKGPRDYERSAANRANSNAAKLDRLTPEELAELQRTAVGEYPGKGPAA